MNFKVLRIFIICSFVQTSYAQMRPLSQLINTKESGWDLVKEWIKSGKNQIEILPKETARADSALYNSQVTTRSPMGAIIYETGGIVVYNGWIRILGSGCKRMQRDVMDWNKGKSFIRTGERPTFLLIADDILGGFFAINAGGISSTGSGMVFYLAPDTLRWENTNRSYSDFLQFCFSGDLKTFYKGAQWKGWEADAAKLDGDKGISCYPFLWTKEGSNIEKVSRSPVPIQELWTLANDSRKQLDIH